MRAEQINEKAKELLAAGQTEEIKKLAEQMGIATEDVEDYVAGYMDELCTNKSLAISKINKQAEEFDNYEIIGDWIEYIKARIMDDERVAIAITDPDKSLKACIAEIIKWSLKNAKEIDKDILKMCDIKYKVTLGIPGMKTAKEIISKYYTEE